MDTSADGVHPQNGMLGVQDPENQQSETCSKVADGIGEREGRGHLVDKKEKNRKESGEDYARKILEFLKAAR